MNYEIIGKCKNCGKEISFMVSTNTMQHLKYIAKCPFCLEGLSDAGYEQMYHLLDTFQTFNERNSTMEIRHLVIH